MDIGVVAINACLFLALYFEVFLLVTFLEKKPDKKSSALPSYYPSATIVVPCYNEEKTLEATVLSLLALHYPKEKLAVLIVDDGSKDTTSAIGQRLANTHPQVNYVYKENGGKYTALNLAIKNTNSEIIGCLDADSFVVPDALLEVAKAFERDPAAMAITPAMKVFEPKKLLELMQSVEYTFGIFYKKMFDNIGGLNVLPGPFSIYRREVFKKIGLFRHAHNTEDMEIAFRMHSHGLKIINAHHALVYTTVPPTVGKLLKQRTRWSQGFLQNSRDYKHMFGNSKYGNFGVFVLPFGLIGFMAGLFSAGYVLFRSFNSLSREVLDVWFTQIPLSMPELTSAQVNWLYINASMTTFLAITALGLTLVAIVLGSRIADTRLSAKSLFSYFALYGFLAPLWLARAFLGAALARESKWR